MWKIFKKIIYLILLQLQLRYSHDLLISGGVSRVNIELPRSWEVEVKLKRRGSVRPNDLSEALCVLNRPDWQSTIWDFGHESELQSCNGTVSHNHLTPVHLVHQVLLHCFFHLHAGVFLTLLVTVFRVKEALGYCYIAAQVGLAFTHLFLEDYQIGVCRGGLNLDLTAW